MHTQTLNDGRKMPQLGLGVWQSGNDEEVVNAIHWALEAGYRHIDTASIYKNEEGVGRALRSASVAREDVWLTTKIWNDDIRKERTAEALEEALERLQTSYVDLLLLHWPVENSHTAWKALERAQAQGKAKSIGLSNFLAHDLDAIMKIAEVTPSVNQIEYHPHLIQEDAIRKCDELNIAITAWSPLMQGQFTGIPLFGEIGRKYGKTPAQVVLRWCLQNDVIVIPKSTNQGRIEENGDLFDFELSEEDMQAIDRLPKDRRIGPDPANFDF